MYIRTTLQKFLNGILRIQEKLSTKTKEIGEKAIPMYSANKTNKIVMTALMMCLITVATMLIRVPIPFTQGYVHLGDAMIFLSVLLLGWKYGTIAAAVGSMLGDVIGGFAMWAPWTLCIKGGMAIIMGLLAASAVKSAGVKIAGIDFKVIFGMILGGAFMTVGYFVAEGVMYGNFVSAALGIPWNIGQFAVGMVIAMILAAALCKTPARKFFTYNLLGKKH